MDPATRSARSSSRELLLRAIGFVRSPYATPLDAPRQGEYATAEAVLDIDDAYAPGLAGIDAHDRILVLWWAHLADRDVLQRPGTDGVFTMRAPHRPNPICISEVRIMRRDGNRLTVTGLEATDGTPILDLKAVRAEADGWMALPRELP